MRFNDVIVGALLFAVALAILGYATTLPDIPGQNIGPSAFPGLLAVILAGGSLTLIVRGWRQRAGTRWVERLAWTRSPAALRNFGLTFVVVLFYALLSERLGFFVCAPLVLGTLLASQGVPLVRVVPIALGVTLLLHVVFYTVLRVPLPWGVLERFAW